MKKIFNKTMMFAAVFATLAMAGCAGFLEENTKTGDTADLTYATKSGIDGLVSSCYAFTRGFYGKEAGLGIAECGTDLFYTGKDNKQTVLATYDFTAASLDGNDANNPCFDHYWEMFYCAVDVCNNALYWVPQNTTLDEKTKNQYLGEVHFLRAFYYFHLVNIWGDVTYNSAPITAPNTAPTRMAEKEVYNKILEDLNTSIELFETVNYKTKADGRANYWAARALKARVLLYKASWLNDNASYALAQAEAEAVIGSGQFNFYDNYSDTWSMLNEDVKVNKEAIFAVTYSDKLASNENLVPKRYKTDAAGAQLNYVNIITRNNTNGGNTMLNMLVPTWNNAVYDINRTDNQNGGDAAANGAWGRALKDPVTYTNPKTGQSVNGTPYYAPYGRGFTRYLPSLYLWRLLDSGRGTDQRTEGTLHDVYRVAPQLIGTLYKYPQNDVDTAIYYCALDGNSPEGQAAQELAKNRYRIQFASGGEIPVYTTGDVATAVPTPMVNGPAVSAVYGDNRYNNTGVSGKTSFPSLKKFMETPYSDNLTSEFSKRDAIVLRLAEMYLIKAECQLGQSNSNGALATINELRAKRAIAGKDNSRATIDGINTILEERAIELCGEQQRWFDLKRTHKLVEYVKARNAEAKNQIQEKHYYRPIPQAQLDAITNFSDGPAEGKFWQNTGY
ncbi:MAG: RagB/SusD family nutrient uptake outer membrane protein [Paludibacter sp.]|jgi:hypothetical protein|nr:RagB/SusD family nutrient uptake outer membrane protein [Paludibacter sp.]